MKNDIQLITREYANKILDSTGKKYKPLGLFLISDEEDGETIWTAIDNSTGDAWTEEFDTRNRAVRWLHGHPTTDRFGNKLSGR